MLLFRLSVTTQPLDVVYNPTVLNHIAEFFSHTSMEGAQALYIERQLREVARVRYEELKNQTRHELVQTLDTMMDGSDVVMMSCSSQSCICRRRKFKLAPLIGNGPYTFENLFSPIF